MSKQKRVYLVFLFVFAVVIAAFLLFKGQKTTNEDTSPRLETIETLTANKEIVLFEDETGFSFKHYNDLTVIDITPNDDEYYSLLSVVNEDKQELIQIKIIDTKYKKLDAWLGTWEKESSATAKLIGAAALGTISANNYRTQDKLFTAAIDQSVLFVIETLNPEQTTKDTYELIIKSFKLALPEPTTYNPGGGGASTIYEPEEVIE